MSTVGLRGEFAVSAATYVPFILVAFWIMPSKITGPSIAEVGARLWVGRVLWVSVCKVFNEHKLRGSLLTVFVSASLCAPLSTFCPLMVKNVFHDGAYQFSMALGALGVGGLLGASSMLALDPKRDHRFISSAFAICYSVIFILASINPFAFGLPVLLIFAGVTMTIINTSANGLLQTQVP